jgi:hypothetical protein
MTDQSTSGTSGPVVELRTYLLHGGERAEYDRIFREEAGPLLEEFGIEVVGHGPSLLDDDHYFLLRAYRSMAEREAAEERFYGSAAWRDGPRQAVISRIVSFHEIVLPATAESIEVLRAAFGGSPGVS